MDCCNFFNTACKMLESVKANDFNKGFAAGISLALLIILLLMIIKIIFKLIFRRKRCKELVNNSSDGDVVITVSAIEDSVRRELDAFGSVEINKLRLYRKRKKYILNLVCSYNGKSGTLPQITQKIKSSLNNMFQNFFGVASVSMICLKFERISHYGTPSETAADDDDSSKLPSPAEKEQNNDSVNDAQDDIF